MRTPQTLTVNWTNVPTRTITAGGVEFAYRELGTNNPGTPVVFLVHLAAVLDNWDPRACRQVGREVNPTVYTVTEFSKRTRDTNAFLTRVLAQPKVWVIGSEHDLPVAA